MNEELMNNTEDQIEEETTEVISPETDDNGGGLAETLIGIGITVIGGIVVSKAIEYAAPKVIGAGKKLINKFRKSDAKEVVESEVVVDDDTEEEQ